MQLVMFLRANVLLSGKKQQRDVFLFDMNLPCNSCLATSN